MLQLQYARSSALHSCGAAPRTAGAVFVAALHALLVYALVVSLGYVDAPSIPNVLRIVNVAGPPDARDDIPPPPPVPLEVPPIDSPVVPDIVIALPQPGPAAITPPALPDAPAVPVRYIPARSIPETISKPEYPFLSRRLGEQGTVRLMLTIGEDGMVIDAQILRSSGSARLDAAAAEWAKMHWRYEPARSGTMPVKERREALVKFELD